MDPLTFLSSTSTSIEVTISCQFRQCCPKQPAQRTTHAHTIGGLIRIVLSPQLAPTSAVNHTVNFTKHPDGSDNRHHDDQFRSSSKHNLPATTAKSVIATAPFPPAQLPLPPLNNPMLISNPILFANTIVISYADDGVLGRNLLYAIRDSFSINST